MATALSEFLQQTTANTIRSNNTWEAMWVSGYQDVDAVLKHAVMYGKNFDLPGRTVEYAGVSYKGVTFPNIVPTHMSFETEHTVTVTADVNGQYRRAFLAWMGKVMNPDIEGGSVLEGDRGVNDKSSVRIQLFDKDNKTVCETYKMYNVQIKNVGPLSLAYEGGAAAEFSVTFISSFWQIESAKNGAFTDQK